MTLRIFFTGLLLLVTQSVVASVTIPMSIVAKNQANKPIGKVVATQTPYGVLLTPHLTGLPPGLHGFHIHQQPSCANNGKAAGGHYDPENTAKHLGPYNASGHLGDLPLLYVNSKGQANLAVLAPRITLSALRGHALMIHLGGDNYSDYPKKLGGGGMRLACGVEK